MSITLTDGQQTAYEKFAKFILDPYDDVFVLGGYSGTGKSTLTKTLLERLPSIFKTAKLIDPKYQDWEIQLTATTNQAADNFSRITGMPVSTIHSFLGLRVITDYGSGTSSLVPKDRHDIKHNYLIFIDEASYIDDKLLKLIFQMTDKCKIIFMGDPAQLTPVNSTRVPVFTSGFKGAELTKVMRQAEGNPIIELSTKFRETVNTGKFFSFTPDNHHIQYKPRDEFNKAIEIEFTDPDWNFLRSKVLAWTNKAVINYNHVIRDLAKGDPNFHVGDYAVCNKFISAGAYNIKTDQMVLITDIGPDMEQFGVRGNMFQVDNRYELFMPKYLSDKKELIRSATISEDLNILRHVDTQWIDLRAAYACTINKAQGSTYQKVFIDLDDIKKCNSGDQIARMLYVAVSRASQQVILTGDLV